MKLRMHFASIMLLFSVLLLPGQLAAQHKRFKLIDMGTLGGPNSYGLWPGRSLTGTGEAIPAAADLKAPDPFATLCLIDCFLAHAAVWQQGVLKDLGSLGGGKYDSASSWISRDGPVAGLSENGSTDPLTGIPEFQAVLWDKAGNLTSVGGLGGNSSAALSVNNGQVLIAGGTNTGRSTALASAELYQPASLTPPNLVSIAVTPANPSIAAGTFQQLIATGTFSDNSTQVLASVTWSSSSSVVAAVSNDASNHGTVFGIAAGSTTITATAGSVSGSTAVSAH